jgi:hypothetical protein
MCWCWSCCLRVCYFYLGKSYVLSTYKRFVKKKRMHLHKFAIFKMLFFLSYICTRNLLYSLFFSSSHMEGNADAKVSPRAYVRWGRFFSSCQKLSSSLPKRCFKCFCQTSNMATRFGKLLEVIHIGIIVLHMIVVVLIVLHLFQNVNNLFQFF